MRFLRVTHSIPDGMAVAVDTPYGTILHTGDFKIDQTPIDGRPTDLHGLAEEARARACTCCSRTPRTPRSPGYTASERSVGPVLRAIVENAPGIVVVACFSSHIHRVQQVIDAAAAERARRGVPRSIDAEQRGGRSPARRPEDRRPRRDRHRRGRPSSTPGASW